MNLCDPHRNRPGNHLVSHGLNRHLRRFEKTDAFLLTGERDDAYWREVAKNQRGPTVETGKIPHFNAIEIQHLPQKIDGETEHLFLAFLNDKAVGSVTARIWQDKSCGVRRMFVMPANRGMGIATRLLTAVEILARQERATHLELSCNRGNVNARQFWIRRKFIDDPERDAQPDPIRCVCMVKSL